jgi:hypothetical protein
VDAVDSRILLKLMLSSLLLLSEYILFTALHYYRYYFRRIHYHPHVPLLTRLKMHRFWNIRMTPQYAATRHTLKQYLIEVVIAMEGTIVPPMIKYSLPLSLPHMYILLSEKLIDCIAIDFDSDTAPVGSRIVVVASIIIVVIVVNSVIAVLRHIISSCTYATIRQNDCSIQC